MSFGKRSDGNQMNKKVLIGKVFFVITCIVLIGVIVKTVGDYSPAFNDVVTHYSDAAPRVGNDVYGYIDVPEGFHMIGSFNQENEDYMGGADGIPEGVQLMNESGTMRIVISLITPDKKRDDYIGFGDGRYLLYNKKNASSTVDNALNGVIDDLVETDILGLESDGLTMESTFVDVNGLKGNSNKWKGNWNGQTYQYQTYVIENPDRKGVFHCLTAIFTNGNEKCVDYLQTFSLSANTSQDKVFVGVEERVGTDETGYINIPTGFEECKGTWLAETIDDWENDENLRFFAPRESIESEVPSFEGVVLAGFPKGKDYDANPVGYMDENLTELYGYLNVIDYKDMSAVKLQGDSREFGAEAFLSVMEQTLGKNGELTSEPVTVDGQQGYRVSWAGRGKVDRLEMYLSFYILENAENPDMVYVIGAREQTSEGQMWKYLDSFTVK